jgi:UDP-N-acetylglucosamine:LPS N-acetylglucosamine transferase
MRIELIYITAGGGHLATARALTAGLQQRHPEWKVRSSDLFQILDPGNRFQRMTGSAPSDFYNSRLARGWTLGMAQELKVFQFGIRLMHERFCAMLAEHWRLTRPDLVVSLVPNFNRAMFRGLRRADAKAPFVTLLTDFADCPPHFWIETGQVQDFICGTELAAMQAIAAGHAPERVHRTSGMVLHPNFHGKSAFDRRAERQRHGLDDGRPVGAVFFGGTGSQRMLDIARELDDTPLVLLCGRNSELAAQLRRAEARAPRVVVEFTDDVPYYLGLADYFIGKPGPGSLSESIAMGLPSIVLANRWTMPQERYNLTWLDQHGVGLSIARVADLPAAVARMERELPSYRERVKSIRNEAVFEVPGVLERIAARSAEAAAAPVRASEAAIAGSELRRLPVAAVQRGL